MAWISSMTRTVLPTPAPPNIAALPPCASGVKRSMTLMPVEKSSVAPLCAASGGGCGESGGAAHQQRAACPVANGTREVEQAAENGLGDRHLERPAGRMGDDATAQSGGGLQRDGTNRRLIQMGLHLGDDRVAVVRRNEQSVVDRRQRSAFKCDIQNRPAHHSYPTIA